MASAASDMAGERKEEEVSEVEAATQRLLGPGCNGQTSHRRAGTTTAGETDMRSDLQGQRETDDTLRVGGLHLTASCT
jgi:hypothetical protein